MEERFNRYLSERYDKEKVLPSEVMSADKKERIMTYLTCGLADSTPSFRHMVKRKGYTIETCDGATRLIIRKTIKVKGDNVTRDLEVASTDEFYGILEQVHNDINHEGLHKTYAAVAAKFSGIPRCVVQQFIELCDTCRTKKKQCRNPNAPTGRPTLTRRPFQRCQIDIIDKTDEPDGPYTCIGLFMDHCSRISVLFPLKTSALEHLIPMLKERVLAYFGLPSILHTDSCPELSIKGLKELVLDWPGRTSIIHGQPGHPQTQLLTESAKRKLDEMLGTMATTFKKKNPDQPVPWASMLPKVQFQMNTYFNKSLHQSPYESLHSVPPPEQGLATTAVVQEEAWDGVIEDRQNSYNRTACGNYFTTTDKTLPGDCGNSGIAGLDGGLGMGQSTGQEQHTGPVTNLDQPGNHSQAAALFCYGLTPMQQSYMQ